jgi:WD40 repeat protein
MYNPRPFITGDGRVIVEEWGHPGCANQCLIVRNSRTGQRLAEVPSNLGWSDDLVVSTDRRLIASCNCYFLSVHRTDDLWWGPVELRNDTKKHFTGLAFHPSGRYLAATSNDGTVKFYDTTTWKMVQAFNWEVGRLRSLAFSPDGMLAAAGGDKGKIVVWDVDF